MKCGIYLAAIRHIDAGGDRLAQPPGNFAGDPLTATQSHSRASKRGRPQYLSPCKIHRVSKKSLECSGVRRPSPGFALWLRSHQILTLETRSLLSCFCPMLLSLESVNNRY